MSAPAVLPRSSAQARGRRAVRMRIGVEVVGRVGSLVALTALLVLAATAGALADGVPAGDATVTATYER
ncbi:hypothetical protein [Pseudonocardia sp. MH-G8]|uniref:hypothetical protein n=1 Tax=Pseudonocardia sp. MH-G8 TaxID=1854588 RepID=UPI00117A90AF|nr:hypothetical protein [Pseudonocardia sp. MH-G8]